MTSAATSAATGLPRRPGLGRIEPGATAAADVVVLPGDPFDGVVHRPIDPA